MHFSIDQEDATTLFRLKEPRLDSQNASQLKAEFLILAQADVETLIVDLSEVQYVDSAGLSALLLAERQQSAHGGDVRLVGVNDNLRSLLSLTQLDRVFPIFATVDEALDAEPSFGDDDDDDVTEDTAATPTSNLVSAQAYDSLSAFKAGAAAAGGSLAAAELAGLMMHGGDRNTGFPSLSLDEDDDEDYDDEDEDLDDAEELEDEDLLDEEDDLDEDDDAADDAAEAEDEVDEDAEDDLIDDLDEDDDDDDFEEEEEDF